MSRSKTIGLLALWLSLLVPAIAQDDLLISITPGNSNRLTLQTDPASTDLYRVFESTPPFLGNQIDLRYSASFEISNLTAPAGWQFQNVTLNDGSGNKVATYYYTGTSASTPNESVNLATPLHLDFLVEDLTGTATEFSVRVEAQVNIHLTDFGLSTNGIIYQEASPQLGDSRLVAFRRANGLALDGADDANDDSQNCALNLFYYAFGLGSVDEVEIDWTRFPKTVQIPNSTQFSYLHHTDGDTDGISYTVESSHDLENWTPIAQLPPAEQALSSTVNPVDSDHERVILTFPQVGFQRYYRIKITED